MFSKEEKEMWKKERTIFEKINRIFKKNLKKRDDENVGKTSGHDIT